MVRIRGMGPVGSQNLVPQWFKRRWRLATRLWEWSGLPTAVVCPLSLVCKVRCPLGAPRSRRLCCVAYQSTFVVWGAGTFPRCARAASSLQVGYSKPCESPGRGESQARALWVCQTLPAPG